MHIYEEKTYPPLQSITDVWNITTPNKFHIWDNAHIPRADVPPPQSTIDVWNTTTPKKFHILANAYIPRAHIPPSSNEPLISGTPLHQISFTYWKMQIYLGQMYLHPLPIDHRSMDITTPCKFHI